jgi:hypothetical protein
MALITPNFRDLGFFPEIPMSKCEPYANQAKELTAAASVTVKMVRTMSNKNCFQTGGGNNQNGVRQLIIDFLSL